MVRRLLALGLGLVVALLLCELGLRVLEPRVERLRTTTVFDPSYGTVRRDSWMFDFAVTPGTRSVRLRGRQIAVPKPTEELRVLFVGDSGTEGVLIELDQTFPHRFADRVGREQLVSINAGVFGMTTLDELHFFRQRLRRLDPDVVVVGLFMSNDINFNLAHATRRRTLNERGAPLRWLAKHSALAHFAGLHMLAHAADLGLTGPDAWIEARWLPRDLVLVDRYGLNMLSYPLGELATYVKAPSPLVDRAFSVLRTAFEQWQRLAAEDGFRLTVLLIPSPSAVAGRLRLLHYPDIHERLAAADIDLAESDLDVGLPTRRVLAICADLDLVCIDPTPRFQAHGAGVFFATDEHPTALGHALLAEALAAEVERVLPAVR